MPRRTALRLALAAIATLPGCAAPDPAPPAAAAPDAPRRSFADFRPSRHGFAFRNEFSGSPLPVSLGRTEETLGLPARYGLCGGMSFAAADWFLAGRTIPAATTPPARGQPLYTYLYARQARSLAPVGSMGLKFMEWMRLPDHGPGSAAERTEAELPGILGALSRGEPVMLGLVFLSAKDNPQPWHNHQVLAYAAAGTADPIRLLIYDPNFPGRDDAAITIAGSGGTLRIEREVPGRRPTHIRGLFRMAYAPASPPGPPPAP